MVFGPYLNLLAAKFTSFSVCHLHYDENVMLDMMRHAIYSYLSTKVPLQLFCSSQIGRALMQMLTCRFLEGTQTIVLSLALFPRHQ